MLRPTSPSVYVLVFAATAVLAFPTHLNGQTPQLSSISPTSLTVGGQVTLTGSGFGATQGGGRVQLNSVYGTIVSWSDTQIVATVSSGATPGNAFVTQNGVNSNALPFSVVINPIITGLSPTSGVTGASVTISGSNFGASTPPAL